MAKPKATCLVLVFALQLCAFLEISSVSGYRGEFVGVRTEIKNVLTNQEVQELGKFSVKKFNKQHSGNGELMFTHVVEAQKQVVSGIKYYMTVKTTTMNGETKMFDSCVLVKPWVPSKELLSFVPSMQLSARK